MSAAAAVAEREPDETPTAAASVLRRYLVADDEATAARTRLMQAQADVLRASGKVADAVRSLAQVVPAGEAVTMRISAEEMVTVIAQPPGARRGVTVRRSRLLLAAQT